jgi:hypothetical protein
MGTYQPSSSSGRVAGRKVDRGGGAGSRPTRRAAPPRSRAVRRRAVSTSGSVSLLPKAKARGPGAPPDAEATPDRQPHTPGKGAKPGPVCHARTVGSQGEASADTRACPGIWHSIGTILVRERRQISITPSSYRAV